ncbi:hypothetical protein E2562_030252 [Oryza meyeriana var. granulata]|uniref:Uncharacterized protein n=1 Tax=Oryza meyeriana var. granulata TaxID=110450 RepID=A0A6G1D957_9ORYZ|nr:hypothetical protein E2562_030252 [Oryza meyeriana var. granulata]
METIVPNDDPEIENIEEVPNNGDNIDDSSIDESDIDNDAKSRVRLKAIASLTRRFEQYQAKMHPKLTSVSEKITGVANFA